MPVAIASKSSAVYTNGLTTLDIPKPTGLSTNDLMIGYVEGDNGNFGDPSGWTVIKDLVASGTSTTARMKAYSKIATSGDVAATNFVWTNPNNNTVMGGIVFRITGYDTVTPVPTFNFDFSTTGTLTPSFNSTVTPTYADSLFLFLTGTSTDNSATITISNYAVTTDNPTWAEEFDQSNGTNQNMSVASATRTQTSATGNASCTAAGVGNLNNDAIGNIMLVISPAQQNFNGNMFLAM